MIVDTSAIMAIVLEEDDSEVMYGALARSAYLSLSAGTWLELTAVLTRRGDPAIDAAATRIVRDFNMTIEPVTLGQAEIGSAACRAFGKGSGHPARLNFGDCFAYALAKATAAPLLFKGDDFARTDIVPAIRPRTPG